MPTNTWDLKELDQEGKDAVPDLIPFNHHVEYPECLPRPLASPDRSSSRRSDENNISVESKTSIWQRGTETRFKLQGGAFLHKTPSSLKNMIVTGIGAWYPRACTTSPKHVPYSESETMTSHQKDATSSLSKREGAGPHLTEHSQPHVPLRRPYQDAVSSSTVQATGDPKELSQVKRPSLKTSRSVPSHQSKVSSLRKKFDSSLPLSVSMPSF